MSDLRLTSSPSVDVGVLIRRPPHPVFEALADPAVTTRFWYTKSSGRMEHGAQLTWEWEMYNVSSKVIVDEVDPDRRIRFTWDGYDPAHPTSVEFHFVPYGHDATYLRITETGSLEMVIPKPNGRSTPPAGSPSYSAH
jgi:uncharacterized protein YndB with AHSA1/START domain